MRVKNANPRALLITAIFGLFLLMLLNNFRPPDMPNVVGMHLIDASIKMEKSDYVTTTGELNGIPRDNCNKNMDINFIPYRASGWKANVKLDRSCVVIGVDWKWRGFDL